MKIDAKPEINVISKKYKHQLQLTMHQTIGLRGYIRLSGNELVIMMAMVDVVS